MCGLSPVKSEGYTRCMKELLKHEWPHLPPVGDVESFGAVLCRRCGAEGQRLVAGPDDVTSLTGQYCPIGKSEAVPLEIAGTISQSNPRRLS